MLYKYTFPTTKRSGLIRTGGSTWFKIEDEPVKIEIGCIAEGVAYMLAIFYAFNMKHPVPLNGGRQARVFQAKGVLPCFSTPSMDAAFFNVIGTALYDLCVMRNSNVDGNIPHDFNHSSSFFYKPFASLSASASAPSLPQ